MRMLILLLTLVTGTAFAAETALQAFAKLPPLATAATTSMDCSAAEATDKKVQAQLAPLAAMPMSAGGSAVQPTPAQIQAMAAMGDPAFSECLSQLQVSPAEIWIQPIKDKLSAKLEQIHADWVEANAAYCRKSGSEGCMGDPTSGKRFNGVAAAAGTQFLKDAQPAYGKYLKEVGDCVARREKGMGGATGGGNNAMDMIFASQSGMNWGLLNLPAAANTSLCEAAREAARKFTSQE